MTRREDGQGLIGLIIAMAILAIVLILLSYAITGGQAWDVLWHNIAMAQLGF